MVVGETRVGRDGRGFRAWSLRTKATDADQLTVAPDEEHIFPSLFEAENDTHLTQAGRWMRRYCLDEVLQLVNVVTGDMSLVGPRAPMSHEVAHLVEADSRLRVRPGLTGVWRDFRRSDLSWSEAVTLDVYYAENWSMLQDLSILVRTIRAAAHGSTDAPR
jgi:lipopolysaccharide/colanic/teichoic acid biosynthesis glycosyltransferase